MSFKSPLAAKIADFKQLHMLVQSEFDAVNALVQKSLSNDVDVTLVQEICTHIIAGGGKRLRPLLVLLVGKAINYQDKKHVALATIVEFLHTATLLHDDVVDRSELRRGLKTAHLIWGNAASVLVGDFIYSRAFQLMGQLDSLCAYKLLADATNIIARGEVLQLVSSHSIDITQAAYLEVIRCKTAMLFAASAACSALLATGRQDLCEALERYGLHLGMAFQLIDDLLDYVSLPQESGKNRGDDLAEGKVTLPLIYAMAHGKPCEVQEIKKFLSKRDRKHFGRITDIVNATGAFAYVRNHAKSHGSLAKDALSALPESTYRDALGALVDLALQREA